MDAAAWLGLLRRRWWLIAACVVVAVGAAGAITASTAEQYESSTRLFVNLPTASGVQEALQGVQLSLNLLDSYAQIATSSSAATKVAERLGDGTTASYVRKHLKAAVESNTLIITITARSTKPAFAQTLASTTATVFTSTIADLESGRAEAVQARVIDAATRPSKPVAPRKTLNLAAGLLLGILAGIAGALVLEALDKSVKRPADATKPTGAPLLATVPRHRPGPPPATDDAGDPAAEAFRSLWTSIHFATIDEPVRSLVVTSPTVGDGKTTVALGLAAAASAGLRVVLVEGDLRRPRLAAILGIDADRGITKVLDGTSTVAECLQEVRPGLRVLVAGPPSPNPAGIAASQAMASLLADVGTTADLIVVDSPPLLAVADAAALSAQADGVVLVLRSGRTARAAATEAGRRLEAVGGRILGVVLNAASRTVSDADDRYVRSSGRR